MSSAHPVRGSASLPHQGFILPCQAGLLPMSTSSIAAVGHPVRGSASLPRQGFISPRQAGLLPLSTSSVAGAATSTPAISQLAPNVDSSSSQLLCSGFLLGSRFGDRASTFPRGFQKCQSYKWFFCLSSCCQGFCTHLSTHPFIRFSFFSSSLGYSPLAFSRYFTQVFSCRPQRNIDHLTGSFTVL